MLFLYGNLFKFNGIFIRNINAIHFHFHSLPPSLSLFIVIFVNGMMRMKKMFRREMKIPLSIHRNCFQFKNYHHCLIKKFLKINFIVMILEKKIINIHKNLVFISCRITSYTKQTKSFFYKCVSSFSFHNYFKSLIWL